MEKHHVKKTSSGRCIMREVISRQNFQDLLNHYLRHECRYENRANHCKSSVGPHDGQMSTLNAKNATFLSWSKCWKLQEKASQVWMKKRNGQGQSIVIKHRNELTPLFCELLPEELKSLNSLSLTFPCHHFAISDWAYITGMKIPTLQAGWFLVQSFWRDRTSDFSASCSSEQILQLKVGEVWLRSCHEHRPQECLDFIGCYVNLFVGQNFGIHHNYTYNTTKVHVHWIWYGKLSRLF